MRPLIVAIVALNCLGQTPVAPKAPPKTASAPAVPKAIPKPPPDPQELKADVLLANGLSDKNPDIRKEAVAAVGLIGPREPYLGAIAAALDDKDVFVRLAAVASLVDLRHNDAIPALEKALDDSAPEVSFAAAKALWNLENPKGREALLSVLNRESKTSSGTIAAKKREMLRMFHTPRTLMIFAVKSGVGMVPVPGVGEGVSSLTLLLTDPSVSGRATVALLFAGDKSPEVTSALIDALSDKDASVRAAAAHAIALRDDPKMLEKLIPLFDDQKEQVRLRAAAAYVRLNWVKNTPPPAKPAPRKAAPVPAKKK